MGRPLGDFHRFLASIGLDRGAGAAASRRNAHNAVSHLLMQGDTRAVDWLLARYPDPGEQLPDEWSIGALAANNVPLLKRLMAAGLDVLAPSRSGTSVIDQAFSLNVGDDAHTADAVTALVAVGADVRGHEEALTYYLGAHHGHRLLQAVNISDGDLVSMALDAGADPREVLQPGGVTILQLLEGQGGEGTLYAFNQPLGPDLQRCAELIRARISFLEQGPAQRPSSRPP